MDELTALRDRAWKEAETRYRKCHNGNHERIRPLADFDEAGVVNWGRVWALTVADLDDPGAPTPDEQIEEIMNADLDKVLEFMYG